MTLELFTDREQGHKPRTQTIIDRRVERALAAMIRGYFSQLAFGIDFPSTCPDGAGYDGTDERSFEAALIGVVPEMEGWLERAVSQGAESEASVPTGALLDAIEWLGAHVGEVKQGVWHDYFRHHHISWDRASGQYAFRNDINGLFARNGLAYFMGENGEVQRVVDGATADILARANFKTGDVSTDQLLEVARRQFFDRDSDSGQHAIEKLWDAFERIKTLAAPTDKKRSAEALISQAAKSASAGDLIREEMVALTKIGNSWRIRHHEVGKTELGDDTELRDYLFLRMFDLIRLLLRAREGIK